MYFSQTWQEILNWTRAFADIILVWFILYYAIKIVRNNSRTIQIFKGIVLILIVNWLAKLLGLSTISWLADMFVSYGFLAVIVIFQPEIRTVLEKLGKSNMLSKLSTLSGNERERLVDEIAKATMILSKEQTGALITLEQSQSLTDYIRTGTSLNSLVTAELLTTIFVPYTPLHDGAVIIQGDKLACASAYFPPTNLEMPNKYGARHRAAIGISEITDSVTIVVSEETGGISIAEGGKIRSVTVSELKEYLLRVLCHEETEVIKEDKKEADSGVFYKVEDPVSVVSGKDKLQKDTTNERVGLFSKLAVKRQTNTHKDESELAEETLEIKIPHNKNKLTRKKKVKENSVESKNLEEPIELKEESIVETVEEDKVEEISKEEKPVVKKPRAKRTTTKKKIETEIKDAAELIGDDEDLSIEEALEIVMPKTQEDEVTPEKVEKSEGGEQ